MEAVYYDTLRELGLSALGIRCYASLSSEGSAAVSDVAERLGKPRNSLYPALARLERWGFIIKFSGDIGPTYYSARPLGQALAFYQAEQRRILNDLIRQQEMWLSRP